MNVYAEDITNIEIFNITQGKVIKVLPSDSKFEKIATDYLKGIKGIYGKFNPIPNKGYAIRIPLESPVKIDEKWFDALINEVIIMFPDGEPPFLVVTDNESRLVCLGFQGNTDKLLKKLKLKLN